MSFPCNFSLFNSIRLTLTVLLTALLTLAPLDVFAQKEKPARSQRPKTEAAAKVQPSAEQTKAEETKKAEQAASEEESRPRDPMSTATFNGLRFRALGPAFTSGRVIGFAVEPNNPSRFFVAALYRDSTRVAGNAERS